MGTSERIKKLGSYFQKMEIRTSQDDETVMYVILSFPNGWILDEDTEKKYGVKTTTQQGLHYFWCGVDEGEDNIFEAIEYNIKKNRDAQERYILYNTKMSELKAVFENETNQLEDLRTLKFVMDKDNGSALKLELENLPDTAVSLEENKKLKKNNK